MKVELSDELGMKCEESEESDASPQIKYEIYESDCNDKSLTLSDSETNVQRPANVTSPIDHSNPFDKTKYICDYCDKSFDKKNSLGSHMTMHKKKCRRKTYACTVDGCRKVFQAKKLLNSHSFNVHKIKPKPASKANDEKKVKICCPDCPKWSTIQHKIDAHIRQVHKGLKVIANGLLSLKQNFFIDILLTSSQPYKCPQEDCVKEFCEYRSFLHHLKYKHTTAQKTPEEKEYRCTYDGCSMEYGLMASLKTHIKRCHLGIKNVRRDQKLICDQCGRSFVDGYSLKVWIIRCH